MRRLTLSNSWTQRVSTGRNCSNGENFRKKRRITEWRASFFAAFQKFVFGAQDWTRTSMPLGAATWTQCVYQFRHLGTNFLRRELLPNRIKMSNDFRKKFLRAIFRRNCLLKRLADRLCAATDRSVQIVGIVLSEFRHFSSGMMRLIRGRREGCCRCVCHFVANWCSEST